MNKKRAKEILGYIYKETRIFDVMRAVRTLKPDIIEACVRTLRGDD